MPLQHGVVMDLTQLRYFLKVAELRSFTRAAEALHIAQPAVTRQVQQLEDELGVQLLLRHSKGAEATEAGMLLRKGAEAMLRLACETKAQVAAQADTVVGRLRIGFPPSVGSSLVGDAIAAYRARYAAVGLHLEEGYSDALRDALLGDRLDAAFVTPQVANPLLDLVPLYDERLWVFFAPSHNAQFPWRDVSVEGLAKHRLIQPSARNTVREILSRRAREQGVELTLDVESESLPVIKSLVAAGLGVHVSPYTSFAQEVKSGMLAGRPLKSLAVTRAVAVRIDRPQTRALAAFLQVASVQANKLASNSDGMVRLASQ